MATEEGVRTIVRPKESAFRSRLSTLETVNSRNFIDVRQFLNSIERIVTGNIRKKLARHNNLKVNAILLAEIRRRDQLQQTTFKTRNEIITPASKLAEVYAVVIQTIEIEIEMETFEIRGSNWVLNRIQNIELRINRYTTLRGRSYVPLPEVLANKKAIINVQNKENKCFIWAVLSALHPDNKNLQRVTKYKKWKHEFNEALKGIEFPVKLTDVSKFAKRTNMSINVYTFDNKDIVPLEITKNEKETHRFVIL
jgi:hypothetical protein